MAKSRWGSVALALAFTGLPVIAQAESHADVQPDIAVLDTTTVAGEAIAPASPMGRVARASFTTEVAASPGRC